jgi:hypothetical protein
VSTPGTGPEPHDDLPERGRRVPVDTLVDVAALGRGGRPPTPAELRRALPPGWVLEPDGEHARRDGRVLFRESWVLLTGLGVFGAAGIGLFWRTFPRGWGGVARAAVLVVAMVVLGGVVAPLVTRAVYRGTGPRR